jgi:hypothetical protein
MNEKLHKKVSPPFEGGVVGMIDYHIYTVFYLPTGVVDSNSSDHNLETTALPLRMSNGIFKYQKNLTINHPGRYQLFYHN